MKITLLGTGTPRPDLSRSAPATVIHTPLGPWLVDCGDGATWQLMRAGIPPLRVTRLIFTHLHADHSLGYGQFLFGGWSLGRRELHIWGPAGTRRMHQMYQEFYADDIAYRVSLGRSPNGLTNVAVTEYSAGSVLATPELAIDALPVRHTIETYALRFRAEGEIIVHGADTAYCEALVDFARGADVLIHDSQMIAAARRLWTGPEDVHLWDRLHRGHSTPAEAARVARLAGVKKLVLIHLPPLSDPAQIRAECATEFAGEVVVGEDLLTIEPALRSPSDGGVEDVASGGR